MKNKDVAGTAVPITRITQSILIIRGHKVLLDTDLAAMYGVETKVLLQAVKRNLCRFPEDFMLQLTANEWAGLRSQVVTLKTGRGQHRKYLQYTFTEQGVFMLSSLLNSERAIAVNIEIMRALLVQLTAAERAALRSQFVISNQGARPRRYMPYTFAEQA